LTTILFLLHRKCISCAFQKFQYSIQNPCMRNYLLNLLGILCLSPICVTAQVTDTANYNSGIWQTFGDPFPSSKYPEIKGRLCNFNWKDLETAPGVWYWTAFDSDLINRTKDGLPVIFLVYTRENAPDWLYTNGVRKVVIKDTEGNEIGYSPHYADPTYKSWFKKMIAAV